MSAYIDHQVLFAHANQNIESIRLFDVSGKHIKTYVPKEKNRAFNGDFNFPNGVYFAKIKLENGLLFTRKLMN